MLETITKQTKTYDWSEIISLLPYERLSTLPQSRLCHSLHATAIASTQLLQPSTFAQISRLGMSKSFLLRAAICQTLMLELAAAMAWPRETYGKYKSWFFNGKS